jgi:hypothetical protein
MRSRLITTALLAGLMLVPSLARAELRRIDLKIFGMD